MSIMKKTLRMLTTALADITTPVDHLSQGKASQAATISAQPGTSAGENSSAAPSACFDPLPWDDPPQMPAQLISRPREVRLTPSHHNSVDINLPTPPAQLNTATPQHRQWQQHGYW